MRALALLFGTRHRSLIFFRATQRDPIGRHVAGLRILLVDCTVTDLGARFAELFSSAKVGQKSFLSELHWTPHISANFCPIFFRVKSNVTPGPSTLAYLRDIFDRTTPLRDIVTLYKYDTRDTSRIQENFKNLSYLLGKWMQWHMSTWIMKYRKIARIS